MNNDLLSILLIAVGLSADCFAVAFSASISNHNYRLSQVLRAGASFGLFQAAMPLLGWLAGKTMVDYISAYDHWVAFGLLAFVSGRMFWESFRSKHSQEKEIDITRGISLLVLSVATSIDALAVGLSFAFLEVSIAIASPTIGVVAFIVTALGFILGKNVGKFVGRWAEVVGAVILLAIALRILLSHVL
jgi:putative Mn2+ efflux pump MntP